MYRSVLTLGVVLMSVSPLLAGERVDSDSPQVLEVQHRSPPRERPLDQVLEVGKVYTLGELAEQLRGAYMHPTRYVREFAVAPWDEDREVVIAAPEEGAALRLWSVLASVAAQAEMKLGDKAGLSTPELRDQAGLSTPVQVDVLSWHVVDDVGLIQVIDTNPADDDVARLQLEFLAHDLDLQEEFDDSVQLVEPSLRRNGRAVPFEVTPEPGAFDSWIVTLAREDLVSELQVSGKIHAKSVTKRLIEVKAVRPDVEQHTVTNDGLAVTLEPGPVGKQVLGGERANQGARVVLSVDEGDLPNYGVIDAAGFDHNGTRFLGQRWTAKRKPDVLTVDVAWPAENAEDARTMMVLIAESEPKTFEFEFQLDRREEQ